MDEEFDCIIAANGRRSNAPEWLRDVGIEVPDEVATLAEARGTCWRGYQQKGFKKKGNRMVPNCVKEEETDSLGSQINFPGYEKKDKPKKPKKKQKPKSMYDKIVGTFTSAFNLDEGINDPHIF